MAIRPISVKMDEALIEKLDAVAKSNHRKRSPEINVAVEFYLKYRDLVGTINVPVVEVEPNVVKEESNDIFINTNFDSTQVEAF